MAVSRPGAVALTAAASTRAGRARDHNEDSHVIDADAAVFAVADGMGGHAAGEVASALAVARVHEAWISAGARRRIEAYVARPHADERRAMFALLRDGLLAAHRAIADEARRDPAKLGMGTTLTGFLVVAGEALFAHAGDSRAYLVRGGAVQLSEDHSVPIRVEGSVVIERRGLLTSALGVGDANKVGRFGLPLAAGDRLVLVTDGVYEPLGDEELAGVASAGSAAAAAADLIETAALRGGTDDATALVVDVAGGGDAAEREREDQVLAGCVLFDGMSPADRLRVQRIATRRALAQGDRLIWNRRGDRAAHVVVEGEIELPGGARLGPGSVVHPDALLDGGGRAREAAAASGPARVLTIRRSEFVELTEEEPDLGVSLYAALARLMRR
ncbi:MAG TPA: protein phosphatase 2C domain-containing protein [Kofleriaceae bacterium]|nr:protein phosphatase 2C domain-containing protein [Kofleriaceae bacterium]